MQIMNTTQRPLTVAEETRLRDLLKPRSFCRSFDHEADEIRSRIKKDTIRESWDALVAAARVYMDERGM